MSVSKDIIDSLSEAVAFAKGDAAAVRVVEINVTKSLKVGQVWLSKRSGNWWRVSSVSVGKRVLLSGSKGNVIDPSTYRCWPLMDMTYCGFQSWIAKNSAVLLPKASADAVTQAGNFSDWS